MDRVYRLAGDVFLVRVGAEPGWPAKFSGVCYRVEADCLALVERPDGQTLQVQAQSAWQAAHRAITTLETYVGGRAEELRNPGGHPTEVQGTWRLPG